MLLEEYILNDYGTIPQRIGKFLLRYNSSTLNQIQQATGLSHEDTSDGLSILIQKRMVQFFVFEKACKYNIIRTMLKRRLYFPIYLNYVSHKYSQKHTEYFLHVLCSGTIRVSIDDEVADYLLKERILRVEQVFSKKSEHFLIDKQHKTSSRYIVVDFDFLDQKIFEEETIKYVKKKYNEAAGSVLRALLLSDIVDRDNIINNLDSTKILVSEGGSLVNDKSNVVEYLRYLCSCGVIVRGFDEKRMYFFNTSKIQLKAHRISIMLKDPAMRRIFNMILNKPGIEDKDITIKSLLSVNKLKVALLSLQKLGLVVQKCLGDYSAGPRIEHAWYVDLKFASLSMLKRIEDQMCAKLEKIGTCWNMNYFNPDAPENTSVWISDLISLATDHLLLNLDIT